MLENQAKVLGIEGLLKALKKKAELDPGWADPARPDSPSPFQYERVDD